MGPLQLRTRKGRAEGQLGQLSPENRHFVTTSLLSSCFPPPWFASFFLFCAHRSSFAVILNKCLGKGLATEWIYGNTLTTHEVNKATQVPLTLS